MLQRITSGMIPADEIKITKERRVIGTYSNIDIS